MTLGARALHFSGHGSPSYLCFEHRGRLHVVDVRTLSRLCAAGSANGDGSSGVRFVFVSACHSRRAGEAFVAAGVPHVVCVNVDERLLDSAALAFTRAFYMSLAVGNSVGAAFEIGKQAVAAAPGVPRGQSEKFLLLPEGRAHREAIFPSAPLLRHWPPSDMRVAVGCVVQTSAGGHALMRAACRKESLYGSYNMLSAHLPDRLSPFVGRSVEMYWLLTDLLADVRVGVRVCVCVLARVCVRVGRDA